MLGNLVTSIDLRSQHLLQVQSAWKAPCISPKDPEFRLARKYTRAELFCERSARLEISSAMRIPEIE